MPGLTTKQRAKINAALSIADAYGDARAIQHAASELMSKGYTPTRAYDAAFDGFLAVHRGAAVPITKITKLIEASDSNTVARYDAALKAYIASGDEGHVGALLPMMRRDMISLAIKTGEVSQEDAHAGRVDWNSMGLEAPDASEQFAFTDPAPNAPPQPSNQDTPTMTTPAPTAPQQFKFGQGTGFRSATIQAKWDKVLMPTTSKPSPYAGMAPDQIKAAMQADAVAPRGFIPDAA